MDLAARIHITHVHTCTPLGRLDISGCYSLQMVDNSTWTAACLLHLKNKTHRHTDTHTHTQVPRLCDSLSATASGRSSVTRHWGCAWEPLSGCLSLPSQPHLLQAHVRPPYLRLYIYIYIYIHMYIYIIHMHISWICKYKWEHIYVYKYMHIFIHIHTHVNI